MGLKKVITIFAVLFLISCGTPKTTVPIDACCETISAAITGSGTSTPIHEGIIYKV